MGLQGEFAHHCKGWRKGCIKLTVICIAFARMEYPNVLRHLAVFQVCCLHFDGWPESGPPNVRVRVSCQKAARRAAAKMLRGVPCFRASQSHRRVAANIHGFGFPGNGNSRIITACYSIWGFPLRVGVRFWRVPHSSISRPAST